MVPKTAAVYGFWQEIKMPDFATIQCENARKNFALFVLIGNTGTKFKILKGIDLHTTLLWYLSWYFLFPVPYRLHA